MDDLSQMSDEDLQRLYSEKKQQQAEPTRAANDFSHLSDDELKKLYYSTRQSKESAPKEEIVGDVVPAPEEKKTGQDWRGDIAAGLRGIRAGIPFARDAATVIESLRKGVPFQEESKRQQERDRALQEEHPKSYFGGEIAGTFMPLGAPAKVLSLGKVAAGPSVASLLTKGEGILAKGIGKYPAAIATGAGVGALQGAGEGEDLKDRIENAISGGKWGAGLGAALPVVGKAFGSGLGGLGRADVEKAAEELRQSIKKVKPDYDISIPSGIASEFGPTRAAANFVAGLPITKQLYDRGIQKGLGQLSEAVENIPGLSQTGLNNYQGGTSAKQAIVDWIQKDAQKEINQNYNKLNTLFAPHANKPIDLSSLKSAAQSIDTGRASWGHPEKSAATKLVENALAGKVTGGSLNYKDAMNLRTLIGRRMGDVVAVPGEERIELSNLYRGLSEDLEKHFGTHGGAQAQQAYKDAVTESNKIINQEKALENIIGGKGFTAAPEKVFNELVSYGTLGGKENIELLQKAKSIIPQNEWNNVASAAVEKMGRSPEGFNINEFIKNYGKLTAEGKNTLFGNQGNETRNSLDNIFKIAERYKQVGKTQNFVNKWLALTSVIGLGSFALGGQEGLSKEAGALATTPFLAYLLTKPRVAAKIYKVLNDTKAVPSPSLLKSLADEVKKYSSGVARKVQPPTEQEIRTGVGSQVRRALTPKGAISYAPITADDREERASGGRLGKGDYPAKRLSRMEKAVIRAQKAIAAETKPIMDQPDHVVARALEIAMNK